MPILRRPGTALLLMLPLLLVPPALADLQEGRIAFSNGDYARAFKEFDAAAAAGDSSGQYLAGEMLLQGRGVPKDTTRGLALMEAAARGGHVGAQSMAGAIYAFGQDMPADYAKALTYLRPAAAAGDMHAQNNLAALLFFGLGTDKDIVEALTWAKRASAKRLVAAIRLEQDITAQASPEQVAAATARAKASLPTPPGAAPSAAPLPPPPQGTVPVARTPTLPAAAAPAAATPPASTPTPPMARPAAPATPPAPAATGGASGWVVQVGSLPSAAEAEKHWKALAIRQAGILDGRQATMVQADLGARGIYTRVMLTGFPDQGSAAALCARLKAAGTDCLVKRAG